MKRADTHEGLRNLMITAMLMALGLVLPFFTGQIPQIGSMLLPMHIPVLLAGFICGWQYGLAVGFILPLFRMVLFGMPPFMTAFPMAFELATYGAVSGLIYGRAKHKCLLSLYRALLAAMVAGRIVWGIVKVLMTGVAGQAFTWKMFMTAAAVNAIPGIILQLILIPAVMLALNKTGFVKFSKKKKPETEEADG